MFFSEEEGRWLYGVLKKIEFFASCSIGEVEELVSNLIKKNYAKGKVLFEQGDAADFLYIIHSGQVGIWVKKGFSKTKISTIGSGAYLGEMSLVTNEKKTATAIVEVPTNVFLLYKDDFNAFVKKNPAITETIQNVIHKRNAQRALEVNIAEREKGFFQKLFGG